MTFYKASHAVFNYSDHCGMALVPGVNIAGSPVLENNVARFARPYADIWNNHAYAPGARIRFNCDAASFTIYARCSAQGQGPWLRSAAVLVNGVFNRWIDTPGPSTPVGAVVNTGSPVGRLIEIVLPSGDSFDFIGVDCPAPATILASPSRPSQRALFIGDSITHGYGTTTALKSWPYLLTQAKGWQGHNMGYSGMTADAAYTDAAAGVGVTNGVQRVLIALGVNDFNLQTPIATFSDKAFWAIGGPRNRLPAPVNYYIITPTWIASEAPAGKVPLEDYRQIIRNVAAFMNFYGQAVTLIEGPSLVPADPAYLVDGLHLNDAGAATMATNLVSKVN